MDRMKIALAQRTLLSHAKNKCYINHAKLALLLKFWVGQQMSAAYTMWQHAATTFNAQSRYQKKGRAHSVAEELQVLASGYGTCCQ